MDLGPGQSESSRGDDVHKGETAGPGSDAGTSESFFGRATVIRSASSGADDPPPPERVAQYRITGRLGRGGMGEVYVARDEKLHRDVALKSIRVERRFDPGAMERFLREARILSSLDDPRICRVYDYLETTGGDYIVLELVDGAPLDRAAGDLTFRERLRVAADLAGALRVAHGAGIVHRDLKPDNVMLTPAGTIKVLDFGLARSAGSAGVEREEAPAEPPPAGAPDDARSIWLRFATRAGQVMGTPLYMSPEQARGQTVTAASDMYSLGLVLQEVFTGERAIRVDATDLDSLLRAARDGRTVPAAGLPRELRRLIESLTAMRPADRPSAAETLTRLERIREAPRRRTRRSLAAGAVVIAVVAGVKYTVDVDRERARAVVARGDANEVLGFMLDDLVSRLEPVGRLDVLEAAADVALEYYEGLAPEDFGDDELFRLAESLQLVGRVRLGQGHLDGARTAFEDARELSATLVARDSRRTDWRRCFGDSTFYIGQIEHARGALDEALACYEAYYESAVRLNELEPGVPSWRLELAYAHQNLAGLARDRGMLDEALDRIERSIGIKRELVAATTSDHDLDQHLGYLETLANGLNWQGAILKQMQRGDEELAAFTEELEARERIAALRPRDADARWLLSTCHSFLGRLRTSRGEVERAIGHFEVMRSIALDLVALDPANVAWQRELALSHCLLGEAQLRMGREDAAAREMEAGGLILAELVERSPDEIEWREQLARLATRRGEVARRGAAWSELEAIAARGLDAIMPVVESPAVQPYQRLIRAELEYARGVALSGLDDGDAAGIAWSAAEQELAGLDAGPDEHRRRMLRAKCLMRLGRRAEALELASLLEDEDLDDDWKSLIAGEDEAAGASSSAGFTAIPHGGATHARAARSGVPSPSRRTPS